MLRKWIFAIIFGFIACFIALGADTSLPFVSPMFGDNMVLQRGEPNPIWGWSTPGHVIRVEIAGDIAKAVAGLDGRWRAQIPPPAPGGPYTVTIDGPQHVELREVLVGDVWLCGGQSNMEFPLERTRNGANRNQIRRPSGNPAIQSAIASRRIRRRRSRRENGKFVHRKPSPPTPAFPRSAIFCRKAIQEDIHIPVGLVEDCLGGTPAETWTSPETLRQFKDFDAPLAEMERLKARGGPEYGNYVMHWYDDYDVGLKSNTGPRRISMIRIGKRFNLPAASRNWAWRMCPPSAGSARKSSCRTRCPPVQTTIHLGVVERMDTTYVNGHWVGASAWVENPRVYAVKQGVLAPGKNVVAIRVFKLKPDGGFMGKPDGLRLVLGDTVIALAGEWKGALSVDASPPHPMPMGFENWPVIPSVLYQGMLKPVAPLAISGAIWYQGEANADRASQYRTLLPAMIGDWRKLFGQGAFPFYFVSLPAFMHHQDHPVEASWAELREAQAITAKTVTNCALAVAIDTGDPDNIHPADKQIVGDRLAFCALATRYGEKIPYQGPTFKSLEHLPGALRLRFDNTDGGLVARNGKPEEFSVAGSDHVWHWADARLEGDSIVVSSPQVSNPEAARYAWQSYPAATLYNGADLPAVPFRTDNWANSNQK